VIYSVPNDLSILKEASKCLLIIRAMEQLDISTDIYVLLTVHLGKILVNNQPKAQFFIMYVYFYSLHVSGSHVPIIRRINCINTITGICQSV